MVIKKSTKHNHIAENGMPKSSALYICLLLSCFLLISCTSATDTDEAACDGANYVSEAATNSYEEAAGRIAELKESSRQAIAESKSIEASVAASIEEASIEASVYASVEASVEASIEASVAESRAESEAARQSIEASEYEENSLEESIAESEAAKAQAEEAARQQAIARAAAQALAEAIAKAKIEGSTSGMTIPGYSLVAGSVVAANSDDIPLIRRLFANAMVIGDSRAKGIVDCGVLTANEVTYYGGASVGTLYDTTITGAGYMRSKCLFIVGLNDCGYYNRDASAFKADYINLINTYLSINPNCEIYLQEILPVQEYGRWAWPNMDCIPEFNMAILEICNEYGYTCVSATEYCQESMVVSDDGAHFGLEFYLYWAQTIANQMGLWETL